MRFRFSSLSLKFGILGFLAIMATGIILPNKVIAASITSTDKTGSILVNVVPENPAPNENTTITLSSYASDLNSVMITWSVNGKSSLSGIGKKSFSVTAPTAGSETTVLVSISLPEGIIQTTIIVKPTVMVLLWQATDSYTPPFYRGKALPSPQSGVRVVAIPEIRNGSKIIDPNSMVYTWQQDYNNMPDSSGYGKNFYDYTNDYLDNANAVSVIAQTLDQNSSSNGNITIGVAQPKIVFYKNDANLGTLWENALSNGYKVVGAEVLQAVPYFISPNSIMNPVLTWNWSINNNSITLPEYSQNLMPLQVQSGVSGTSKIDLEIRNSYKVFENVSKEINVNF